MKKLLLTFDDGDNPGSLENKYIFHNPQDMEAWFIKNSSIFTKYTIIDNIVSFTVNHSWKGCARFEYVTSLL